MSLMSSPQRQFKFTFTSSHMNREVGELMTTKNVYCHLHKWAVYQPCYEENVIIERCSRGKSVSGFSRQIGIW